MGSGGVSGVRGFQWCPEESCTCVCAASLTGSMHFLRLAPPLQDGVREAGMHAYSKKSLYRRRLRSLEGTMLAVEARNQQDLLMRMKCPY